MKWWQFVFVGALMVRVEASVIKGTVTDAATHKPIPGAIITTAKGQFKAGVDGSFQLDSTPGVFGVRAQGYLRGNYSILPTTPAAISVALTAFRPKGLYLSFYGIGSSVIRGRALDLIDKTELNTLVVDVKGDRGMIPWKSAIPDAHGTGPQKIITVRDMPALMADLHKRGIYLIARIVSFKDDPLANAHHEWAVKDAAGHIWHDREGLAWIDPSQRAAWGYNLDIAEEAAKMGFDEIQFDYVRFPDTKGLRFSQPSTEEMRVEAITGFLQAARQRLSHYNVFVDADIFGYVAWNENDTFIGQEIQHAVDTLDYVSPMLYPSGFTWGIPGARDPVAASGTVVQRSLEKAEQRTKTDGVHFRPWLQSFKDYAFDRRKFGADDIRKQIDAAEAAGTDGWLLWNPRNDYSDAGLEPRKQTIARP